MSSKIMKIRFHCCQTRMRHFWLDALPSTVMLMHGLDKQLKSIEKRFTLLWLRRWLFGPEGNYCSVRVMKIQYYRQWLKAENMPYYIQDLVWKYSLGLYSPCTGRTIKSSPFFLYQFSLLGSDLWW